MDWGCGCAVGCFLRPRRGLALRARRPVTRAGADSTDARTGTPPRCLAPSGCHAVTGDPAADAHACDCLRCSLMAAHRSLTSSDMGVDTNAGVGGVAARGGDGGDGGVVVGVGFLPGGECVDASEMDDAARVRGEVPWWLSGCGGGMGMAKSPVVKSPMDGSG